MKYNVLKKSEDLARRELKWNERICGTTIAVAVILNVLFTLITNDSTMTFFLVVNIVIDVVVGVFSYTFYLAKIHTQKKLIALFDKRQETITGCVEKIGSDICTHLSVECFEVTLDSRIVFLPIESIELSCGESIVARCSSNVIIEVEKC